jgi:hypothetical protein
MAFLSSKLPWDLANTKWAAELNPIISLPFLNGNLISNIKLIASTPLPVNHLLQRMPQGWFLFDNTANAVVWRSASFTTTTITLESSANTTVALLVF